MESERLTLRPIDDSDIDALLVLWNEPDLRRQFWGPEELRRQDVARLVAESKALAAEGKGGLHRVSDKGEPDTLVGFGGYWQFQGDKLPQIIFGLAPDHWGMGLATELARLLIAHGLDNLELPAVRGGTDAANVSSQRVMEKAGMSFVERVRAGGKDIRYYEAKK